MRKLVTPGVRHERTDATGLKNLEASDVSKDVSK